MQGTGISTDSQLGLQPHQSRISRSSYTKGTAAKTWKPSQLTMLVERVKTKECRPRPALQQESTPYVKWQRECKRLAKFDPKGPQQCR